MNKVEQHDGDFTCLSLPAAVLKPKMWTWFSTGGGHQGALVGVNGPTFSLCALVSVHNEYNKTG